MMHSKLTPFFESLQASQKNNWVRAIDSGEIAEWIDNLFRILFPEKALEIEKIAMLWNQNKIDFDGILTKIGTNTSDESQEEIIESLYAAIPNLYDSLQQDAQALLNNDPAADSIQEIINSYPGFSAIAIYRVAHTIAQHKIGLLPRILTEYAHSKTGIDIHPNATIDVPFVIDHGTGIVIGESAIIGKNVHLYQGVTLGALQVDKNMEEKKRHPTVENNVVIYANATILGGSTVIGSHSVIGGNTFITRSVNPYSLVMQSNKNTIINQQVSNDTNLFSI